ncbi:MAG: tRNA dihydrouridine synthase [Candidatus Helarchaeota archaeon]
MRIKNLKLSNKTVLAPLANFSNHAFHIQCRRNQAALIFTQMYHIHALYNNFQQFEHEFEIFSEEHPVIVQLIGDAPDILAKVMEKLESYNFEGYDLNLGCPSLDAIRCDIGGALLNKPEKICSLLNIMVNATNRTVSAKIRTGIDNFNINAVEIAKLIESEGANFITVHGRTVKDNYSIENNLSIIRECKRELNIPVIGNGDIKDGPSAQKMLKYTKCDLIMIGRKAMGYPRIFLEVNEYLKGNHIPPVTKKEYLKILQEFFILLKKTYPTREFKFYREKLSHFIRPKLIDKNIKSKIQKLESLEDLEHLLHI